ncbi:IPT/TIG domain-containing protein [Mesonia aestuariivivens]|uniref:IPT/TIG domain-containing protein n=1 Tax=Mesonia aestuariivivens TaxID=2796128 RepID=A0ABS6W6I0_9FLAO|nr:IPT/TIG domain-containing protein [Mesonia aestuariivivens]MBW2962728.1 IPT/TIG domain-containing protein [Mesonia aestuariivivens]
MKNINFKKRTLWSFGLLALLLVSFTSCEGDDTGPATVDGPPSLERVSLAIKDSTTSVGMRQNMYRVYGDNLATTQMIFFNDTEAYFNPTLVTNNTILVSVPKETPYFGASDKLRVVTSEGEASLDFVIAQPAPIIDSFTPLAAGAGEIVTITGSVFEGLESVKFGETEAVIVSATENEIQVEVPEGIVQSFIFVETPGGVTQSEQAFGFKFVIYDDVLNASWWSGGWGGTQDFESTEQVKRGQYAIKRIYEGTFSGFQLGNGGAPLEISDYAAIKVSIYGGDGISDVKMVINGDYDNGKIITINQGEWNNFTIPFSDLGATSGTLNEIVIQEFSGQAPAIIYIDDLGLI